MGNFLKLFLLLLSILVSARHCIESETHPVATIPSLGQIRGSFMSSASGRNFSAFRGIPYAKPPVGDLRFKDPVAVDHWKGVEFDATKEGPKCIQMDINTEKFEGVEDCLKLNIFTHNINPDADGLKPVLVWIHGGAFKLGSGNGESDFHGPGYIMNRDVVLVTINYRLGALGFFSTTDEEAPGNYGLLDQTLALRWVKDHVQHFGGDPESVTIFGHSAGAASAEFHILSPHSKELFHRAIVQSGSALCSWAYRPQATDNYSKMLVENLNCSQSTSKEIVQCLREKDPQDFVRFAQSKQVLGFSPISIFGPRLDSEREFPFLPDDPEKLLERNQFNAVPFIVGSTENEGAFLAALLVANGAKALKEFTRDPLYYIPYLLGFEFRRDKKELAQKIHDQYFSSSNKSYEDQLSSFEMLSTDFDNNAGVNQSIHLFRQYSDYPVFYYQYSHRGSFSFAQLMGAPADFDQGVGHGDEIFQLFTNSIVPLISAPDDVKVSNMLIDLWTSFATDGLPRSDLIPTDWLPLDPKLPTRYMSIEARQPGMINHSMPSHNRLTFWRRLFVDTLYKDEL